MRHHPVQISNRLLLAIVALLVTTYCHPTAAQSLDEHLRLGKDYAGREQWKEAEEHLRIYRQANPNSAEATVLHAKALINLRQPFDAILELEELLAINPDSVPALKLYATLLYSTFHDSAQAEEVRVRSTKLAPDDVEVWIGLGALYLAKAKYADAIECYEQADRLLPHQPLIMAQLAYSYAKANRPAQAAPKFDEALRLNARAPDAVVYLLYADYLLGQDRYAESVSVYTKALSLNPRLADAYYGRASAYLKLKEWKQAEADALAVIREAKTRKDVHILLIRIYRSLNKPEDVEKHAALLEKLTADEQAQQALSRDLRASLRTAEPLLREGKFAEAAKHYEEIVRLLPTFYEAYFALGISYSQTARPQAAETAFKKYLSFQPLSADGHAAFGLLLAQQNRPREAQLELERALQLDPSLLEARKALARVYFSTKNFAAVSRELNQTLNAEPTAEPELYVMLATAQFHLKEKAKAIETSERGLRAHPDAEALEEFYVSLLLDCGQTVQCKAKLIESLKQKPTSPHRLKATLKLLLQEDPLGSASKQLTAKIVETLPDDPEAHYLYSQWAYLNNDYKLCVDVAERALSLRRLDDQTRMRSYALMALAEDGLNNPERAEAAFRTSLELNRKLATPSPYAALRYVEFLVKRSRDEDAQRVIDDVLRWAPTFGPARFERAKFLANRQQSQRAIEEAKLVLQYSTDDQQQLRAAHAFLAKTYFAMGRPDEAKVHQNWIESQNNSRP